MRTQGFDKRFHPWETAALLALCLVLCCGVWAQARQSAISAGLIRLHVVAVSDDEAEQALKLRVRDAVLARLSPLLEGAADVGEAEAILRENLAQVSQAAEAAAEGRAVRVSLEEERFPTRQYEGFVLPAGAYKSLRVVLGEGRGHNWWCIVFPPLCVSAAEADGLQEVMNQEDLKLITESEGYELRFKIVELWGELSSFLQGK